MQCYWCRREVPRGKGCKDTKGRTHCSRRCVNESRGDVNEELREVT